MTASRFFALSITIGPSEQQTLAAKWATLVEFAGSEEKLWKDLEEGAARVRSMDDPPEEIIDVRLDTVGENVEFLSFAELRERLAG